MRNMMIGILIGMLLGTGIAWAAERITLVNGANVEIGTASNPLYIQSI